MTSFLEHLRKPTPPDVDLDALAARVSQEVEQAMAGWRAQRPEARGAIVEIRIPASGQVRRRLRRYKEIVDFHGPPGVLISRYPTSENEYLIGRLVEVSIAVSRAGAAGFEWRLMTVAEAISAPD